MFCLDPSHRTQDISSIHSHADTDSTVTTFMWSSFKTLTYCCLEMNKFTTAIVARATISFSRCLPVVFYVGVCYSEQAQHSSKTPKRILAYLFDKSRAEPLTIRTIEFTHAFLFHALLEHLVFIRYCLLVFPRIFSQINCIFVSLPIPFLAAYDYLSPFSLA